MKEDNDEGENEINKNNMIILSELLNFALIWQNIIKWYNLCVNQ